MRRRRTERDLIRIAIWLNGRIFQIRKNVRWHQHFTPWGDANGYELSFDLNSIVDDGVFYKRGLGGLSVTELANDEMYGLIENYKNKVHGIDTAILLASDLKRAVGEKINRAIDEALFSSIVEWDEAVSLYNIYRSYLTLFNKIMNTLSIIWFGSDGLCIVDRRDALEFGGVYILVNKHDFSIDYIGQSECICRRLSGHEYYKKGEHIILAYKVDDVNKRLSAEKSCIVRIKPRLNVHFSYFSKRKSSGIEILLKKIEMLDNNYA